jgi:hypothetical protein
MDALLLTLIGWLNLHTPYDTRVDLPNIVITESANLCQQYGITDPGTCKATHLKGFYNKEKTIYLHADFDVDNPNDRSRLLHELVHYIQWHNEAGEQGCWGLLEAEAYMLQDEWRWEHDIDVQTDPFKLVMLEAACDA